MSQPREPDLVAAAQAAAASRLSSSPSSALHPILPYYLQKRLPATISQNPLVRHRFRSYHPHVTSWIAPLSATFFVSGRPVSFGKINAIESRAIAPRLVHLLQSHRLILKLHPSSPPLVSRLFRVLQEPSPGRPWLERGRVMVSLCLSASF